MLTEDRQHHSRRTTTITAGMSPSETDVSLYIERSWPVINSTVRHDALFESSKDILALVFPHWKRQDIDLHQCKDGITNKRKQVVQVHEHVWVVLKCTNLATSQVVLVRAFGTRSEIVIDRKRELLVRPESTYSDPIELFSFVTK